MNNQSLASNTNVLNDNQITEIIVHDHFMASYEVAKFYQEVPKEQYTERDVMEWLGY